MKNVLLALLFIFYLTSCITNDSKTTDIVSPFKSGDIAYLKIDTSKVVISLDLGLFDNENFLYRVSFKNTKNEIDNKFVLSSELFKK